MAKFYPYRGSSRMASYNHTMHPDQPDIRVIDSLSAVPPAQWDALVAARAGDHPVLRHAFLHALHESGCASQSSGWLPQYLSLWRKDRLAGAMPLYLKNHSYGEYVFDWAWADAYHRAGMDYYPKLLCAVPFTPISGPRLIAEDATSRLELARAALKLAGQTSSLHVLFPQPTECAELKQAGMMLRTGVQFHWINEGFSNFEAFLATLASAKRKKIRQERRKVAETGVRWQHLVGTDIRDEHWQFFVRCYGNTYRAHHSSPYLNLDFFRRLGADMPENLLLVLASLEGRPIACSLNLFSPSTLYGRYWGCVAHVPLLHFEACYYQTLEFCIEHGIRTFEGGAQGEHKLARGFRPVQTCSAHWLSHPAFSDAVERFLERESNGMDSYMDELNDRMPFRKPAA